MREWTEGEIARRNRLNQIVRDAGSRAHTMRRMIPIITEAAKLSATRPARVGGRTTTRAQYAALDSERRLLQSYRVRVDAISDIYLRWRLRMKRISVPPTVIAGGALRETGSGYSHRWGGAWKSAPGSYVPSTASYEVGIRYLAGHCRDLSRRRIGGASTIWEGRCIGHAHGYEAYRAATPEGPCTLVMRRIAGRKVWAYHADATLDPLSAIAVARENRARQRKESRVRRESLLRTWVGMPDSLAAGNCEHESRATAEAVRQRIKAQGEFYVRSDVLLGVRSDDYALRAVAHAQASRPAAKSAI